MNGERFAKRSGAERHEIKGRLYSLQQRRCAYCGARKRYKALTFDHVMPLGCGGLDVFENLLLACEPCNVDKAGRPPTLEFHEAIRMRIHGRRAA